MSGTGKVTMEMGGGRVVEMDAICTNIKTTRDANGLMSSQVTLQSTGEALFNTMADTMAGPSVAEPRVTKPLPRWKAGDRLDAERLKARIWRSQSGELGVTGNRANLKPRPWIGPGLARHRESAINRIVAEIRRNQAAEASGAALSDLTPFPIRGGVVGAPVAHPGGHREASVVSGHCWKGEREHIEEVYGEFSEEYCNWYWRDGPSGTCMLPEGHDGPHAFTPEDEIVLAFKGDQS